MSDLSKMPISCSLRRFSIVQTQRTAINEEGWQFVSGEPLTAAEAKIANSAGVRFLELNGGGWAIKPHVSETQPGVFNLSYIEQQAPLVRSYGMAPLFSFCTRCIAPWQMTRPDFEPIRCLQHGTPSHFWSVWSNHAHDQVQRIVHEAARRMNAIGEENAPVIIDGFGDFGEPIFPQGLLGIGRDVHEMYPNQTLHVHPGYWCGDELAMKSLKQYTGLDTPPSDSSDEVAWVSFIRWYHDGMTQYIGASAEIYRKELPRARLMTFMAGGREPCDLGQDNSGLAKAVAPYGVAIRSTSSGGMYLGAASMGADKWSITERFERSWAILKRHATAAKFYGAQFWTEPPYPPGVDPFLIPARMFEAMSCGAVGFHEWVDHLLVQAGVYQAIASRAVIVHPLTHVAVYFPRLDHWIANDIHPEDFWRIASKLRRFMDYDVIDDRMILDGALRNYQCLVIPQATRMTAEELGILNQWARSGGIIVKRPEALREWPSYSRTLVGTEIIIASDMEDQSLITRVLESISDQGLVACDERPVYTTRCVEGWLILNLCEESQMVKVNGRSARIASGMFELIQ